MNFNPTHNMSICLTDYIVEQMSTSTGSTDLWERTKMEAWLSVAINGYSTSTRKSPEGQN